MKLVDYLRTNNLKPSSFAVDAGVPPSTITRLLKRERTPSVTLLRKIEAATDGVVTLSDLTDEFFPSNADPQDREAAA